MDTFKRPMFAVSCLAWLLMIAAGIAVLANYQHTPGHVATTPETWPSDAKIPLAKDRATLLMFAHPKCPCTQASVEELNRLLARSSGKIATHVFFLKPEGAAENWAQTALWRSAAAIPDVAVHEDFGGVQEKRFGAETSGFIVLYDANGKLLFKGGITAGRGHAGDNAGANAVVSLSMGRSTDLRQTPVYGCSLVDSCCATSTPENL